MSTIITQSFITVWHHNVFHALCPYIRSQNKGLRAICMQPQTNLCRILDANPVNLVPNMARQQNSPVAKRDSRTLTGDFEAITFQVALAAVWVWVRVQTAFTGCHKGNCAKLLRTVWNSVPRKVHKRLEQWKQELRSNFCATQWKRKQVVFWCFSGLITEVDNARHKKLHTAYKYRIRSIFACQIHEQRTVQQHGANPQGFPCLYKCLATVLYLCAVIDSADETLAQVSKELSAMCQCIWGWGGELGCGCERGIIFVKAKSCQGSFVDSQVTAEHEFLFSRMEPIASGIHVPFPKIADLSFTPSSRFFFLPT